LSRLAWSPSLPVAAALAVGPAAGVLQSKALAPIAVVALLLAVLAHRRQRGTWPWPRGAAAWLAIGLFGWAAVTALWAIEPLRALGTSLQIGGFAALGAAAARAVAEDAAAAHRRLLLAATGGLAAGILLAGLDAATGHAIRAAVRGLREVPQNLAFGLKPAASAMALWLPLVAAAPLPRPLRAGVIGAGAVVLVLLPGEAAKLAVLAGLLVGVLALLLPRLVRPGLGAVLAVAVVAMPVLLGPVLARGVPAAGIPPSAAHRLLIWDFVIGRIADRPLLGWGMEASRSVPGHRGHPTPEAMARFGLDGPESAWLATLELLPLHPHNGALQLRLELGWPGVLLAAALAVALAMACASPVALAMLAAGAVTAMLSFGIWQEWWVGAELLAAVAATACAGRIRPGPAPGG
jgi:O-antigen ligase